MSAQPRTILVYQASDQTYPFEKWLKSLRDIQGRAIIRKRLNRIRLGNLGDAKSVGEGVMELRIDVGPGYRVYFAQKGEAIIILLCGGDKDSQRRDIKLAKKYWSDFLSEKKI